MYIYVCIDTINPLHFILFYFILWATRKESSRILRFSKPYRIISMLTPLRPLHKKCFLYPPPSSFIVTFTVCSFQPPMKMNPGTSRIRSSSNGYLAFFSRSRTISSSVSPTRRKQTRTPIDGTITLQEWQGWGTTSPVPVMVSDAMDYLKALERDTDAFMSFGGNGGRLMVFFSDHLITQFLLCILILCVSCTLHRNFLFDSGGRRQRF